ncbi:hypothetical protein COT60_00860, partial [Candidatus Pacearchaeota archaeon CG09_land_8_20_14_0_10_30_9]
MEHIDFRDQISRNKRNSIFLMVFVILVIVLLGWTISNAFDPSYFFLIMIVSIIFSIFYVWINFYNSDKIAIKSVGAKLADR